MVDFDDIPKTLMTTLEFSYAPIAIFAYNRPDHLKRTVDALLLNREAENSNLYIFSDGPKNDSDRSMIEKTRQYASTIKGFKSLTLVNRSQNLGLAKAIITGVTEICEKEGQVIVLEDDLVTAPYFLDFMNSSLRLYKDDEKVASIHGYMLPVKKRLPDTFFFRGADCLGWATWKRAWDLFELDGKALLGKIQSAKLSKTFDLDGAYPYCQMLADQIAGKNNSWAIRWHASMFIRNMLTLNCSRSLVQHIGNDGSGTNFGVSDLLDTPLASYPIKLENIPIAESMEGRRAIAHYYAAYKFFPRRVMRKALNIYRHYNSIFH